MVRLHGLDATDAHMPILMDAWGMFSKQLVWKVSLGFRPIYIHITRPMLHITKRGNFNLKLKRRLSKEAKNANEKNHQRKCFSLNNLEQ